jgi:hypothetical protein
MESRKQFIKIFSFLTQMEFTERLDKLSEIVDILLEGVETKTDVKFHRIMQGGGIRDGRGTRSSKARNGYGAPTLSPI